MIFSMVAGCGEEPAPAPKPQVQTKKIAPPEEGKPAETPPQPATATQESGSAASTPTPAATATISPPSQPQTVTPSAEPKGAPQPPPVAPAAKAEQLPAPTPKSGDLTPRPEGTAPGMPNPSAAAVTAGAPVEAAGSDLIQASMYVVATYDPAGRFDPFEALFKEAPSAFAINASKDKRQKRAPQTPLEQVALSQIKLSAIIRAPSGNRALVEDATGKGYVVSKGTFIGLNSGQVVQIDRDRLIIEEEVENLLGELTVQTTELKLQKPAGEL